MICPNCQTQNPDGARFCFNCGTALSQACGNCGTELPAGARFCFNCGQPTAAGQVSQPAPPAPVAEPVTGPPARPQLSSDLLQRYIPQGLLSKLEAARQRGLMEGERRIVTILFCDVKGSTAAAAGLDPEEWSEIINGAFEHMIGPVYRYEGTVARLMGDGLLAFFGAPIAHEDDPQRAVLAGLGIVQAVGEYAENIKSRWGLDFNVRVGINTGLVVVGAVGSDLRMEYTALGDAINLAARMEQTAVPGTVQIAAATHKLVAPLFDFEPLGEVQIKGKQEPVAVFRVLAAKEAPGSLRGIAGLRAPLIGRQEQLEKLQAAVAGLYYGSGQIVSVMGEAGLGKSRLVAELQQAVTADHGGDLRWVEGRSHSFETKTPFAPFIELFRDYFDLQPGQADKVQVSQIKARIEDLLPGRSEEMAPFFATLLDLGLDPDETERVRYLEPPQLRSLIFAHIFSLIERQVVDKPLVLFLDDLHWVDPTSLELLESLLPLVERTDLMIITAFRPRRQEPSWGFHETAARDYHHRYLPIILQPLDQDQSRDLVASLLTVEDLPLHVRQAILDKSEGNPFFVEEIIRSLLDQGLIVREDGHWRATRQIRDITIPDTLNGVITARLDRLDEGVRLIVQAAAILGHAFEQDVLGDIVELSSGLEPALIELQRRQLILEKSRLPRRSYIFKHILSQEAAYDAILLSNRRELHRRAAESLQLRRPEQAADIARHWLAARQPARALPYLVEAGDRAARAYASTEAIEYYNQALEHQSATQEFDPVSRAYEGLGDALVFANRLPEALDTYQALLALGEAHKDAAIQISALNKLAATTALRLGHFQDAERYLARSERLAQQHDDKPGKAELALIRCQMCTAQADFDSSIKHMAGLVEIGQTLGSKDYIAMGLEHVANSMMYLARFKEARETAEEGLRVAREIGDREHEALLLAYTLSICAIRDGDFDKAKQSLAGGLQIGTRIGSLLPQVLGYWVQGELARWQGEYEPALSSGLRALDLALPVEEFMPYMVIPALGSLGSTYLNISDQFHDEISRFHHHALHLLESPAATMTAGTAWADLGHCALALGDLELADEVFRKGLNVPTLFVLLERPRLLAGAALVAQAKGKEDEALRLAQEAHAFAEEKGMHHMLPLTWLTLGKLLATRGESTAALEALSSAESAAAKLEMRPIVWQSRLTAAGILETLGDEEAARAKRAGARVVVEEIAGLLQDDTLRTAYLESAGKKVGG